MVKTQVQLPDHLYAEAKRVARERELSLAEVIRRGVEYITRVYPPLASDERGGRWSPPPPTDLGEYLMPPEQWRVAVNEPPPSRRGRSR